MRRCAVTALLLGAPSAPASASNASSQQADRNELLRDQIAHTDLAIEALERWLALEPHARSQQLPRLEELGAVNRRLMSDLLSDGTAEDTGHGAHAPAVFTDSSTATSEQNAAVDTGHAAHAPAMVDSGRAAQAPATVDSGKAARAPDTVDAPTAPSPRNAADEGAAEEEKEASELAADEDAAEKEQEAMDLAAHAHDVEKEQAFEDQLFAAPPEEEAVEEAEPADAAIETAAVEGGEAEPHAEHEVAEAKEPEHEEEAENAHTVGPVVESEGEDDEHTDGDHHEHPAGENQKEGEEEGAEGEEDTQKAHHHELAAGEHRHHEDHEHAAGEHHEEAHGAHHHEHGEHHGHEEGEEEEEEAVRECIDENGVPFMSEWCSWDLDSSIMILGVISFVMVLFYLTNWPDDDIRLYSWEITSATISIFCAVLLFQGFNTFLRKAFLEGFLGIQESADYGREKMSIFQILHCFVYLACIHFATGMASGVINGEEGEETHINRTVWVYTDALRSSNNTEVEEENIGNIRAVARAEMEGKECTATSSTWKNDSGEEIPVQKKHLRLMQKKRQTKAWGMLFAHMAGFAAICSGTCMQQLHVFANSKVLCWAPVIINQCLLRVAFLASGCLREWQLSRLGAGGGESASEKERKEAELGIATMRHLMKEESEESENDVSSLSMSYLTVNVIRWYITGFLPNEEGEEGHGFHPELWHVFALYFVGFMAVGLAVGLAMLMSRFSSYLHHHAGLHRILEAMLNATGMCFAWCLLWATKWICKEKLFSHEMLGRVSLAFVLTSFAAFSVFAVDKVADSLRSSHGGDRATLEFAEEIIRIIINSLGILVGFSWEHSFDGSVVGVSQMTPRPVESELVMGIAVAVLILPAWRDYILQKVMLMQAMLKIKRCMSQEEAEEVVPPLEATKRDDVGVVASRLAFPQYEEVRSLTNAVHPTGDDHRWF